MSEQMSNADKARSAALVDEDVRTRIVEYKGARILVRQPTVAEQRQARAWATVKMPKLDDKGERVFELVEDKSLGAIAFVLSCAADPDTGKPLFGKAHFDSITTMRNPAIIAALTDAVKEVCTTPEVEEARGNSDGEESSGSSTGSPPSPDA